MKKIIITLSIGLLASQLVLAQGSITYLSNLGQLFTSSNPVAGDSWLAASFSTGANPTGYLLDSIDLGMANATGNPSGFTVMVYSSTGVISVHPGSNLGTLDGSNNPSTAAIYTYTPVSDLILLPDTLYYIVLTAGTAAANGAYEWNYANTQSYNPSNGWLGVAITVASHDGGLTWGGFGAQYDYSAIAITATPVPEPSSAWLLLLGGGVFFYVRKRRST